MDGGIQKMRLLLKALVVGAVMAVGIVAAAFCAVSVETKNMELD